MRFSNIKIIFSYPEEEIMTDIYNHTLLTILMFIVLLVIFIVVLNHILKRLIEKPLKKIVNFNLAAINEEDTINNIASSELQPNFDNMVHIIEQLIEGLNSGIIKLNTKNAELEGKNIEIEALYQQTSAMNITLHQYLEEIKAGYIVTVRSLSNAIEAKDKYTKGHCERVTAYALETAKRFDFSDDELTNLEYAAILHDVGKIGMSSVILNKPKKLTEEEYETVKQHPSIGYDILKDIEFLKDSIDIVLHHHERVDGKGYPDGKTGDEITLATKILAVADAYDAMTSSRPYRKDPLSMEEAISILNNNSGTQFDANVVQIFIDVINY
jgi:HD-GYP domain-containing protein (c-di-GMP phosphodiesterase class II)